MSGLSLVGRKGVIAGVSSKDSVGFHCAVDCLRRGAEVVLAYRPRPESRAPSLARELGCHCVECDAGDDVSIQAAAERVAELFGRVDFLVHTLVSVPEGVLQRPLSQLGRSDFSAVLESGAYSLLALSRHFAPLLERSEAGRIVTLLSAGADFVLPNYHAVGIAKAALAATLRYLAAELAERGVLCNGVNFSLLETAAAQRVIGQEVSRQTATHVAKRSMTKTALQHEDVTAAIAYLCSSECRNMTGEVMRVDGGFCLNYF